MYQSLITIPHVNFVVVHNSCVFFSVFKMSAIKKLLLDVNGNLRNTLKVLNIKPMEASLKQSLVQKMENIKSNTHAGAALNSKVIEVISWYDKISGMDEVREAQNKVLNAEMQFVKAQAQRREAHQELATMQKSLKDLREEIDSTTRGEKRYILLVTKEHELLQEEQKLIENFNHCEDYERETFTILSCAVKDSHEKERSQALRTKYWSLIASVVGTLVGLVASTINGHARMKEIKKLLIDLKSAVVQPPPTHKDGPDLISSLTPLINNAVSESEKMKDIAVSYYETSKNILLVSVVAILITCWFR